MIEDIKKIISKNIDCFHLEILDESPNHGGYSGQVSHIKVIIVSDLFVDKSLINRHKEVYRAMENYVSEISLELYLSLLLHLLYCQLEQMKLSRVSIK